MQVYIEKPRMTKHELRDYFDRMARLSPPPGYFNITIQNDDMVNIAPDSNLREFIQWQIEFLSKSYILPPINFIDRSQL